MEITSIDIIIEPHGKTFSRNAREALVYVHQENQTLVLKIQNSREHQQHGSHNNFHLPAISNILPIYSLVCFSNDSEPEPHFQVLHIVKR